MFIEISQLFHDFRTLIRDNSFITALRNFDCGRERCENGTSVRFRIKLLRRHEKKKARRREREREGESPHSDAKLIRTTLSHAQYLHAILIVTQPSLPFAGLYFQYKTFRVNRASHGDFCAPRILVTALLRQPRG